MESIQSVLELVGQYALVWWVQCTIIVVLAAIGYWLLLRLVDKLKAKAGYTRNLFDDAVIGAFEAPAVYALLLVALALILDIVDKQFEVITIEGQSQVLHLAGTVLFTWFVLRLIRIRENQILKGEVESKADRTTISAIFKVLRLSVLVLAGLVCFQTLGFSLSGVIAFGGVGGAAVAFAAKDLLANFFGGLMVYMDKPFAVGDWIRSPDQNIEGTVEYIGWRVTRIRTFDKRPLYVPNSVFTQISIENPSRMTNRRIYENIGVRYSDFSHVEAICKDVRRMLIDHPEIDDKQTLMVNFNRFADSSLEFFIYTFTHTTDWQAFHHIKQDVLVRVGQIIESYGAEIAFPSQSVYVETPINVTSHQN